jgi:hypothetical protein
MLPTRSNWVQCNKFLKIITMALINIIKIWYGKKFEMFQKLAQLALALPLPEHFHFLLNIVLSHIFKYFQLCTSVSAMWANVSQVTSWIDMVSLTLPSHIWLYYCS